MTGGHILELSVLHFPGLNENSRLIARIHKALDVCLTAVSFIAAYFIKKDLLPFPYRGLITDPNYYVVLLMIIIIWYVVFDFFNLYTPYRKRAFTEIFWNMAKATSTAMVIMILCMYVIKITDVR